MHLQQASRKQTKIRLGLQGPSGSGKTYGALLIAFGLCEDWSKIAVIDTEHGSASLYSHLGLFNTVQLTAPFFPERYKEAIQICNAAGMEVIVIDSISHEWDGPGGILDIHGGMPGNSFTNWNKVTPRHNLFVQAILQSQAHVICTIRSKQDYVLSERNGKMIPEKVGMKAVQREGLDYELTVLLELDINHTAKGTKDRTSLFADQPPFRITPIIGHQLNDWAQQGDGNAEENNLLQQIENTSSVEELVALFKANPEYQNKLQEHFTRRRKVLQTHDHHASFLNHQNPITHE